MLTIMEFSMDPSRIEVVSRTEADIEYYRYQKFSWNSWILSPSSPDSYQNFMVYCNASKQDLGSLFMQNDQVIAYASQQLRNPKKNYPTHDPELVAVVHALKTWRHYLIINKCDIHTDYKSLKYSISRNELNMRQHR